MRNSLTLMLATLAPLAMGLATPALADDGPPTFGDDSGHFAKDGECDDMRFAGPGMTTTLLIDSDILHDATDCRAAFNQGRLIYMGGHRDARINALVASGVSANSGSTNSGYADSGTNHIMWGDDSSKYSKDGECDDKRFEGPGMTNTPLLDSDIKHDATDCRTAFNQGRIHLRQ